MADLAKIRAEYGYTQGELAEIAGLHQTAVSHIELNRRKVSMRYARALDTISNGAIPWESWFVSGDGMYGKDYVLS